MATSREKASAFGEFVRGAAKASEAQDNVTLTGEVLQGDTEGTFVLVSEGSATELPIEAVVAFDVLEDSATRKLARVVLKSNSRIYKLIFGDPKRPWLDPKPPWMDLKQAWRDPLPKHLADPYTWVEGVEIPDPRIDPRVGGFAEAQGAAAAGAVPFTMATGHQAPAEAVQAQFGGATQFKRIVKDPITDFGSIHVKDVRTDPISDIKRPWLDGGNTGIADTLVEGGGTLAEGGGTLAEGIGGIPGGPVVGPQF